ncbi:unnamed protein product [Leuciscus chuanchicus]
MCPNHTLKIPFHPSENLIFCSSDSRLWKDQKRVDMDVTFVLSSSGVLEQIRAELKPDLEKQWANLPWDTLAGLFRMKVETSVCFYGLRPQSYLTDFYLISSSVSSENGRCNFRTDQEPNMQSWYSAVRWLKCIAVVEFMLTLMSLPHTDHIENDP